MIFITGASGLVGTHLIKSLLLQGKQVVALFRKNIPQFENKIFITAAIALANMIENPTPEKIIPSMFDKGVKDTVYNAVSSLSI